MSYVEVIKVCAYLGAPTTALVVWWCAVPCAVIAAAAVAAAAAAAAAVQAILRGQRKPAAAVGLPRGHH